MIKLLLSWPSATAGLQVGACGALWPGLPDAGQSCWPHTSLLSYWETHKKKFMWSLTCGTLRVTATSAVKENDGALSPSSHSPPPSKRDFLRQHFGRWSFFFFFFPHLSFTRTASYQDDVANIKVTDVKLLSCKSRADLITVSQSFQKQEKGWEHRLMWYSRVRFLENFKWVCMFFFPSQA